MKTVLFLSLLLCGIAMPAMGALTDADLDKIRLIVKEEVKKESTITNAKIDALDTRLRTVETDVALILSSTLLFFELINLLRHLSLDG